MLQRLAPKLVKKFHDTDLLVYIGKPLHPRSIGVFAEFSGKLFFERDQFHGDAEDYLMLLMTHLDRTFEMFIALGGFTRSRVFLADLPTTCVVPAPFSSTDAFLFRGILEKLDDPEMFMLLTKPLPAPLEQVFAEIPRCALDELRAFSGTPFMYVVLLVAQLHQAIAEVIALHKFGTKTP